MSSEESIFNEDLKAFLRPSGTAKYCKPLSAEIERAIALREAISSIKCARASIISSKDGEPDKDRIVHLLMAHYDLGPVLMRLKVLNGE